MLNTNLRTSAENIVIVHPLLDTDDVYNTLNEQKLPVVKETTGVNKKLVDGELPDKVFQDKLMEKAFKFQDKIFITDYPYHDSESFNLYLTPSRTQTDKYLNDVGADNKDIKKFLDLYRYRDEDTFTSLSDLQLQLQDRLKFKAKEEHSAVEDLKEDLKESGVEEAANLLENKDKNKFKKERKVFKPVTSTGVEQAVQKKLKDEANKDLMDTTNGGAQQ